MSVVTEIPGERTFDIGGNYEAYADNDFAWLWIERPALERALPSGIYHDQTRVLDIGGGSGRTIRFHRAMGVQIPNIVTIEPAEDQQKRLNDQFEGLQIIKEQVQETTLSDLEPFDIITAQFVFRYLDNQELESVTQNAVDSLRPGGRLVILDAHPMRVSMIDGRKRYHEEGQRTMSAPWGGYDTYFYRKMATYLNTVYDATHRAGLRVQYDECPLPPEAESVDPIKYIDYQRTSPSRFVISAVLPEAV
jgi:SAM-dependent methyltransferase